MSCEKPELVSVFSLRMGGRGQQASKQKRELSNGKAGKERKTREAKGGKPYHKMGRLIPPAVNCLYRLANQRKRPSFESGSKNDTLSIYPAEERGERGDLTGVPRRFDIGQEPCFGSGGRSQANRARRYSASSALPIGHKQWVARWGGRGLGW